MVKASQHGGCYFGFVSPEDLQKEPDMKPLQEEMQLLVVEHVNSLRVPILEVEGIIKGKFMVAKIPTKRAKDGPLVLPKPKIITSKRAHTRKDHLTS